MSAAPDARIRAAAARAAAAKARLSATAGEIQRRLSPDDVLRGAVDSVREKSAGLAEDALAAAKSNPAATAGAAAGVAAFAMRRPIGRLVRKLFSRRNESGASEL